MKTITWKVDKTIPTECPDYRPDPYTGAYPQTHCAVYHCKTITEEKTATFEKDWECESFINNAPSSCYEFKINGELAEDKRQKITNTVITDDFTFLNGSTGGTVRLDNLELLD